MRAEQRRWLVAHMTEAHESLGEPSRRGEPSVPDVTVRGLLSGLAAMEADRERALATLLDPDLPLAEMAHRMIELLSLHEVLDAPAPVDPHVERTGDALVCEPDQAGAPVRVGDDGLSYLVPRGWVG